MLRSDVQKYLQICTFVVWCMHCENRRNEYSRFVQADSENTNIRFGKMKPEQIHEQILFHLKFSNSN